MAATSTMRPSSRRPAPTARPGRRPRSCCWVIRTPSSGCPRSNAWLTSAAGACEPSPSPPVRWSMPPSGTGPLKRAYRECDAWRERALRLIEEEQPELVLIASADMYDVLDEQGRPLKDSAGGSSAAAAAWDAGLASYLGAGRRTRSARRRAGRHAAGRLLAGRVPGHESTIEACDASRERMVDEAYAARESRGGRVRPAWPSCRRPTGSATDADCPLVRGSTLVYRDGHHLTATFAEQLGSRVGAAIDAVTGNDLARD